MFIISVCGKITEVPPRVFDLRSPVPQSVSVAVFQQPVYRVGKINGRTAKLVYIVKCMNPAASFIGYEVLRQLFRRFIPKMPVIIGVFSVVVKSRLKRILYRTAGYSQ